MTGTDTEQAIAAQAPARLDEVMMAMDVVDTLRHQQDLVDHALAQDEREADLVARIRSIYANQGIEVSDAIISEGVEALKKDRFSYRPPPPSWRLRLARVYVRRGTWARRVLGVGVLGLAAWLVYDIQGGLAERSRGAEARSLVEASQQRIDSATARLVAVQRDSQELTAAAAAGPAAQRLHDRAGVDSGRAAQAIQQARETLASVPETAAADRSRIERGLAPLAAPLQEAEQALTRASASLSELRQLDQLEQALGLAEAKFAGVDLDASVQGELSALRRQARRALDNGDVVQARSGIDRLDTIAGNINLSYELHIVSRPNEQTGVWRHPADNPRARNYYVIVDAIGADGRPLQLPITSEEDGTTRTVSTFGIRVPEHVFEAVRADKMDNGLIDRPLFAVKRRGRLDPDYRHAVAGGMITTW